MIWLLASLLGGCCTNTYEIKSDGPVSIYASGYELIGEIDQSFIIVLSNWSLITELAPKHEQDKNVLYASSCVHESINEYVDGSYQLVFDTSFYFNQQLVESPNVLELDGVELKLDEFNNVEIHFGSDFVTKTDSLQGTVNLFFQASTNDGKEIENEFTAKFNL